MHQRMSKPTSRKRQRDEPGDWKLLVHFNDNHTKGAHRQYYYSKKWQDKSCMPNRFKSFVDRYPHWKGKVETQKLYKNGMEVATWTKSSGQWIDSKPQNHHNHE